jgi:hypothetical protein
MAPDYDGSHIFNTTLDLTCAAAAHPGAKALVSLRWTGNVGCPAGTTLSEPDSEYTLGAHRGLSSFRPPLNPHHHCIHSDTISTTKRGPLHLAKRCVGSSAPVEMAFTGIPRRKTNAPAQTAALTSLPLAIPL